jgi:deoxycytidine triphosphate deaminase
MVYHADLLSGGEAMLVIGNRILEHLNDADPRHIRNSSYYLTIGALIPVGKAAENFDPEKPPGSLTLEPGQLAWVVSQEVFNIKSHKITALVTLRSTLTKKGLLALDVGIVDPDFEGPIGSVVINFSKNHVLLSREDEFFRVIFIEHEEVPAEYQRPRDKYTADEYIKKQRAEIISSFPETFLNREDLISQIVAQTTKEIEPKVLNNLILQLIKNHYGKVALFTLAVMIVAGITFFGFWSRYGLTDEQVRSLVNKAIEQQVLKPPGK